MKKTSAETTSNSNNIYDIICYYNEVEAEPQHANDVIKKIEKASEPVKRDRWIKWKLFGCLMINVLLSAPIYSYGTIYVQQKELFDAKPALIWPPIIFNSISLFVTPWLFNSISTPASRHSRSPHSGSSLLSKVTNKQVIVIFSLILSIGISVSGFAFAYLRANLVIVMIFYSIIGGMSSCIIMGKLFVLINGILNNDRLHLINFIYSFGQALAQFLFPFLIQLQTRWVCYNCSLIWIGALMFNIIPITMLVIKDKISITLRQQKLCKSADAANVNDESRYSDISAVSFDFGMDIKYPSDLLDMEGKWKNPSSFEIPGKARNETKGDNFLEELESHRIMNAEGVEILQTILESEEEIEIKFPDQITIDDNDLTDDAIESIYEEINRKYEEQQQKTERKQHCSFLRSAIAHKYRKLSTTAYRQVFNPLRRSMKIFKFYPSVILKSCDTFSYLLFVTVILPNLTLKQFQLEDQDKVIYLIMLMGLCWIVYALLVLRHHNRLKQSFIHYFHIIGLLGKFFGYLFTNQRYSINSFIFGLVLISLGHANSFHLQEIMIRNCFHPRKWFYVRGSIYNFSGFLILIYCATFHVLNATLPFVTFCNIFVLFNLSGILVWLLTHYKSLIYICSRY